jgi:hypothetical protein
MDNSSENDDSNNSLDKAKEKLDSIYSDREKLNQAANNVNPEDAKNALKELQKKYPDQLEDTETKEDFLSNIDKKLISETEKIKHEHNL